MRKKLPVITHNGHEYEVVAEYRGFKLVRSAKDEGRRPVCAVGVTQCLNKDGSVQHTNPIGLYNIGPTVKACKSNLDYYAKQNWIPFVCVINSRGNTVNKTPYGGCP